MVPSWLSFFINHSCSLFWLSMCHRGYGEAVCSLLHSLLLLTMARTKRKLVVMSHSTREEEEEEGIGQMEEEEEEDSACGWSLSPPSLHLL